jgi:hypothetical protein
MGEQAAALQAEGQSRTIGVLWRARRVADGARQKIADHAF